jgi:hypothetical protein
VVFGSRFAINDTPSRQLFIHQNAVVWGAVLAQQRAIFALPEESKTGKSRLFSAFHRHFAGPFNAPIAPSTPARRDEILRERTCRPQKKTRRQALSSGNIGEGDARCILAPA